MSFLRLSCLQRDSRKTAGGTDERAMRYLSDGQSRGADSHIRITEPLGEKWVLSTMGGVNWSRSEKVRDAFDAAGRNDFYSSRSRNDYIEQQSQSEKLNSVGSGSGTSTGAGAGTGAGSGMPM